MMCRWLLCALLALLCGAAVGAAPGKPLVFCAGASPEGFDSPLLDSASTSTSASTVTTQIFVMSPHASLDFAGGWRE